jgi:hypothetical protein
MSLGSGIEYLQQHRSLRDLQPSQASTFSFCLAEIFFVILKDASERQVPSRRSNNGYQHGFRAFVEPSIARKDRQTPRSEHWSTRASSSSKMVKDQASRLCTCSHLLLACGGGRPKFWKVFPAGEFEWHSLPQGPKPLHPSRDADHIASQ